MNTIQAKRSKIGPQLKRLFDEAAAGNFPKDETISLIMRAKPGFESEHFETTSEGEGTVLTGNATLAQIEELIKDPDVHHIERPRTMFPR